MEPENRPDKLIKHHRHTAEILKQITNLLEKQLLVEELVERQEMPQHQLVQSLVRRQQATQLHQQINRFHPADIAMALENLPPQQRSQLWTLVDSDHMGAVLIELSDSIRQSLLHDMGTEQLMHAAWQLESDELADLLPQLPSHVVPDLLASLEHEDREQVKTAAAFPQHTVGALMDFDILSVRVDNSLDVVLRFLRRRGSIPEDSAVLMVVDRSGYLRGTLSLEAILVNDGDTLVEELMDSRPIAFHTDDPLEQTANAFERYNLITAPVINAHGQLLGCLNVEAVLEYIRKESQKDILAHAGLREDEDIFAPVWRSGRNRWPWLALNLCIAFIASRIIAQFEDTITQVVALAALLPITVNVGGNAGNQAMALMIRSLALNQLTRSNFRHLLTKELAIGVMNGLVWGGIMGLATWFLYQRFDLALIMVSAMVVTLVVAALTGIFIPVALKQAGQDPVLGSSILITGITDTFGFLIFLGLAAMII
jgi:magnesium transporter